MKFSWLSASASLALSLAVTVRAEAQTAVMQSVTEREQLQHADLGIHVGSFLLLPEVDMTLSHNNNVYASNTDHQGDFFLDTRIAFDLNSQFARHEADVSAYFDRNTYFKLTGEDTSQFGGKIGGRYDIGGDGAFTIGSGFDRVAESRTSLGSFTQASKPVMYDLYHGDVTFSDKLGPLSAILGFHARHYQYHDADFGSGTIDQSFRDFTVIQGTADIAYELHSLTSFVIHGQIERRRYDLGFGDGGFDQNILTDRSANGTRIEAGIQRQITSLVQATVRFGWLHYSYLDPRLKSLGAFSYHGDLVWNVTPLTTIEASADRRVDETVSITYAGNLRDEFKLDVRHELLRNFVLLLDTRYANIRPTSVNTQIVLGPDQLVHSREFQISGGAHYYIGRYVRLDANLMHAQRHSADQGLAFSENVATIGITLSR